jgi:membrane protease YdiL (CAAX protease family)
MASGVRFPIGVALVLVAIVGLFVNLRAFDRSAAQRELHPHGAQAWTGDAGDRVAVSLGRYALPAPGVLRVVLCPHAPDDRAPVPDPHASLRVRGPTGVVVTEALTPDRSRGERCFDASYRTDVAGAVEATVVAPAALRARGVREVDVFASRRITPLAMWPALTMLLGFLLVATAPRRGVTSSSPTAEPPQPYRWPLEESASVEPPAPIEWRWSPVLAIGGYLVVHVVVAVIAAVYLLAVRGGEAAATSGTFIGFTLLVQHGLLALVAAWMLGAFQSRAPRLAVGLLPATPAEIARAVALGLLLVGVAVASTQLIRDVSQSKMGELLQNAPARYAVGFGALLAPLTEELFFRGVLVKAFGKRSLTVGVVASALIFTVSHAFQLAPAWIGLVPIAAVALVNGWLRARTGGITQPWLVHTVYNAALSAGLYFG